MADWTLCRFEPLDVIVTADARPLDIGGFGQTGEVMPAAFAGSLRTLVLKRAGYAASRGGVLERPADHDLADRAARVAGFARDAREAVRPTLEFFGPLYGDTSETLLLPAPRSALRGNWTTTPVLLETIVSDDVIADADLGGCSILLPEIHGKPRLGPEAESGKTIKPDPLWWPLRRVAGWLARNESIARGNDMATLVAGRQATRVSVHADDPSTMAGSLVTAERRSGHARSQTGVPEDGALFSRGVRRFKQNARSAGLASSAFVGLARGDDGMLPAGLREVVRLGGDGHQAQVSFAHADQVLEATQALLRVVIDAVERGVTTVQMYLATPALFDAGWHPRLDPNALRLRAASVGRPQIVAGWDLRERHPKPVRRAVPAGSVYFYEILDRDRALGIIRRHHLNESVSDIDAGLGFGCALFGVWRTGGQE